MSQVEIPLFTNGNFILVTVKIIICFQPKPSLVLEKKKKGKNCIHIPFLLVVIDDSWNGLCYLFLTLK